MTVVSWARPGLEDNVFLLSSFSFVCLFVLHVCAPFVFLFDFFRVCTCAV